MIKWLKRFHPHLLPFPSQIWQTSRHPFALPIRKLVQYQAAPAGWGLQVSIDSTTESKPECWEAPPSLGDTHSSLPSYYQSFVTCICFTFPCLQLPFSFNTFKSPYLPIRLLIALLFSFFQHVFYHPHLHFRCSAPPQPVHLAHAGKAPSDTKCTNQNLLTGFDATLCSETYCACTLRGENQIKRACGHCSFAAHTAAAS